jgi:hypothetical protein
MDEDTFEIKFTGNGVHPTTVRFKELSDILSSLEDAIVGVISDKHADLKPEDILIGLTMVEDKSLGLFFKSTYTAAVTSSMLLLSNAIANNDYSELPTKSFESLRRISHFTQRRNCEAHFISFSGNMEKTLAILSPKAEIKRFSGSTVIGDTSIIAYVVRAGGKEPSVGVILPNEQAITCNASIEIVRSIGPHIYKWVGLTGKAIWNESDYSLKDFTVKEIRPYEGRGSEKSLNELKEKFGQFFDEIDPNLFFNEIRQD